MTWGQWLIVIGVTGCAAASDSVRNAEQAPGDPLTARGVAFKFDGDPSEWRAAQSTFTDAAGVHTGSIWVDETDSGLVVAGVAFGEYPKWPTKEADLPKSDRIVLALADAGPPEFPPVGWGHQFGYQELASSADCARTAAEENSGPKDRGRCVAWFEQQLAYRDTVAQLFERHWVLAPGLVRETFANRAFDSLEGRARDLLKPLKPGAVPIAKFATPTAGAAYGFEAMVPWEAFPPMRSLDLREIRLGIRFASPSGSPAMNTLVKYTLPKSHQHLLTPCGYGLDDSVAIFTGNTLDWLSPSQHARAYYIPSTDRYIGHAFILDNEVGGYMYEPGAETRSPIVRVAEYWTRDLGKGDVLCGPRMAVRTDRRVVKSDMVVDRGDRLEIKTLAKGDRLIKDGPRVWMSYYGSGQCGACPRAGITIYYQDESSGKISRAWDHVGIVEVDGSDIDYAVSPDWQQVVLYEGARASTGDSLRTLTWTETSFCFRPGSRKYVECGRKNHAAPPSPRNINPDSAYQ